MNRRRLWGFTVAFIAFLIATSCASNSMHAVAASGEQSAQKMYPQYGPWSCADIDARLGEAASIYAKAGGIKGDVRAEFISEIRQCLSDMGSGETPINVAAEKINYTTEYACEGEIRKAWNLSGIVFLPIGSPGQVISAPIISFQHGTQVYRDVVPSRFDPNPGIVLKSPLAEEADEALLNYLECEMGASLAGMGYIVVMPDYPGFGDSTDIHPYIHSSLGDCVRDAIVETISLTKKDQWADRLAWNGRLYLIGYSEGGYATMVGAKSLSAMTVGKIPVTAAVPCGGAYDLSGTMIARIVDHKAEINPIYAPFAFVGYEAIYGDSIFRSSSPFKERYSSLIPCLFDGDHWAFQTTPTIPRAGLFSRRYKASDILNRDLVRDLDDATSPVFRTIRDNDAYRGWKPDFPMRIVHGQKDDIVPVENALAAYSAFGGPETAGLELVYVEPVDFASAVADVHTRTFITALIDGFNYIYRTESLKADNG